MYTISNFRSDIRAPYAWPGGYPRYFVASDGEAISFEAARERTRKILEAIRDQDHSGWRIVACEINWEDADLYCAHTGKRIESAYAKALRVQVPAWSDHWMKGDRYGEVINAFLRNGRRMFTVLLDKSNRKARFAVEDCTEV